MNTGDVIQINTLDFDPDIDGGLPLKDTRKHRGRIVLYNTFWENPRKAKPLLHHNKLQKKWIGQTHTSRDPTTIRPGQQP